MNRLFAMTAALVAGATAVVPMIATARDGWDRRAQLDRRYDYRTAYYAGDRYRPGYAARPHYWRDGQGRLCYRRDDGVRRCNSDGRGRR